MLPVERNLKHINYHYTQDDMTTLLPNAGLESTDDKHHVMKRDLVSFADMTGNNDYFYQAMLDYLVACKGNPSENMRMVIPTSRENDHWFNVMVQVNNKNINAYEPLMKNLGLEMYMDGNISKVKNFPKTREELQAKINSLSEHEKYNFANRVKHLYSNVSIYTVDSNPLADDALTQQNSQLHAAVQKGCAKATAPQSLETVKQTQDADSGPLMVRNNNLLIDNKETVALKEAVDIKALREAHALKIENEINEIIAQKKELTEIEARAAGSFKGNPPKGEGSTAREAVLSPNDFKEFFEGKGYTVNGNIARHDKIKIRYEDKDGEHKLIIEGGNGNKAVLEAALEYEIARQQKLGFDPVTLKFKCADEKSKEIFENYIEQRMQKGDVNIKKPEPKDYEMQKGGKSAKGGAENAMGGMDPAMMQQLFKSMGKK